MSCLLPRGYSYLKMIRFPLPEVPPGWTPNPHRVWDQEKDKENAERDQAGHIPRGNAELKSHADWKASFMSADQVRLCHLCVNNPSDSS